jgi:hypothetical protein
MYVKKKSITPVPAEHYPKSKEHTKHGTVFTSGAGKNNNNIDYHSGAIQGQDTDHRTQESSGDSLGHGNQKVGTPATPKSLEDYGLTKEQVRRIIEDLRHIPD